MPIEFSRDVIIKGKNKKKQEIELRFRRGYIYGVNKVVYRRNKSVADLYLPDNSINPFAYIVCESVNCGDFETCGNCTIEIVTDEDD